MSAPSSLDRASERHARVAEAIQAALAQGLSYEDDVFNYVDEIFAPHDEAVESFLGILDLTEVTSRYEKTRDLEQRVATAPRGTWAVTLARSRSTGQAYWNTLISDGSGKIATGGRYADYDCEPTYAHVARCMRAQESYGIRKDLRHAAQLREEQEAVRRYGIRAGNAHKDVDLGENGKANQIFIDAVNEDTGLVEYSLTKRGSRTRYRGTMSATSLVKRARLMDTTRPPANNPAGPPSNDDLPLLRLSA